MSLTLRQVKEFVVVGVVMALVGFGLGRRRYRERPFHRL